MKTEPKAIENQDDVIAMRVAMALIVLVALSGVIAWLTQGENLVAVLVQQGLAWCF